MCFYVILNFSICYKQYHAQRTAPSRRIKILKYIWDLKILIAELQNSFTTSYLQNRVVYITYVHQNKAINWLFHSLEPKLHLELANWWISPKTTHLAYKIAYHYTSKFQTVIYLFSQTIFMHFQIKNNIKQNKELLPIPNCNTKGLY